jgi:flavodoxin
MPAETLVVYYSLQGHTRRIARKIAERMSADLFEIELEQPYHTLGVYITGLADIRRGVKPVLKGDADTGSYDTVFLGAPVWWYTLVPPLRSFLDSHDFSGKTVIPFCCAGGRAGKFFEVFSEKCNAEKILPGKMFADRETKDDRAADQMIDGWLTDILSG